MGADNVFVSPPLPERDWKRSGWEQLKLSYCRTAASCLWQSTCSHPSLHPLYPPSPLNPLLLSGTSIIQVTATDADDPTYGNSAKLVYTLVQGQQYFSVDPQTGECEHTSNIPTVCCVSVFLHLSCQQEHVRKPSEAQRKKKNPSKSTEDAAANTKLILRCECVCSDDFSSVAISVVLLAETKVFTSNSKLLSQFGLFPQ